MTSSAGGSREASRTKPLAFTIVPGARALGITRTRTAHLRRSTRIRALSHRETNGATILSADTSGSLHAVTPGAQTHAETLRRTLISARHSERASKMAVYVRGKFEFIGVQTPQRRELTRAAIAATRDASASDYGLALDVGASLWNMQERECQLVALDVLDSCRKFWPRVPAEAVLRHLHMFITQKSWWDTVDMIASHAVYDAYEQNAAEVRAAVERWAVADDMWLRRTAILWQLRRKTNTDSEMMFRFIELNMNDEDFFIRKAIGWALRHYRRTDPAAVDEFVQLHRNDLSKLSVREAWRHKT